jgi:hypothetical protein
MPGFLVGPLTGFVDRMKGKGVCSSSFLQQIGKSSAQSAGGGNIFSLVQAVGAGNAADTTDDTLMSCSLPANLLDVAGRCVTVQAFGTVAATSDTKTLQFKFGAASLQPIVSYATTGTGSWQMYLQIYKVSANVQALVYQVDASGSVATVLGAAVGRNVLYVAGAQTDTSAIPLVITGKSAGGTANLVLCNGFIVDAYN